MVTRNVLPESKKGWVGMIAPHRVDICRSESLDDESLGNMMDEIFLKVPDEHLALRVAETLGELYSNAVEHNDPTHGKLSVYRRDDRVVVEMEGLGDPDGLLRLQTYIHNVNRHGPSEPLSSDADYPRAPVALGLRWIKRNVSDNPPFGLTMHLGNTDVPGRLQEFFIRAVHA